MNHIKLSYLTLLAVTIITYAPSCLMAQSTKGKTIGNDTLLNMIPDDLLFAVRVNNLNGTTDNIDSYITGISPIPVSVTMLLKMQLGQILADPSLSGINLTGDFMSVGFKPKPPSKMPSIAVFTPVANADDFIKNHPSCTVTGNNYYSIKAPGINSNPIYLAKSPSSQYLIVTNDLETLPPLLDKLKNKSLKKLATALNAFQATEAIKTPVWGYANLKALCTYFNEDIEIALKEMSKVTDLAAPNMPKETTNMLTFFMNLYGEALKTFTTESDIMTLAITPTANMLSVNVAYQALAGTQTARMFVPNKSEKGFEFAQCFDSNKAINGFIKINDASWKNAYQQFFNFMSDTSTSDKDKEVIKTMRQLTDKGLDAIGESVAYTFNYTSEPPYIAMEEIVAIDDKAAFKRLITEATTVTNDLYKLFGFSGDIQYKPGVKKYKGIDIDHLILDMAMPTFGNTPINYDGKATYTIALFNDKLFMTTGEQAIENLERMIDAKQSTTPAGDIKLALDMLGADATKDMVQSVNIIKMAKGYANMMGTIMGKMPEDATMFAPILKMINAVDTPTQSCIGMGATLDHGQVRVKVAIPKKHLSEIMTAVMQIQQKIMMQQMQTPKQKTESKKPAVTPAP